MDHLPERKKQVRVPDDEQRDTIRSRTVLSTRQTGVNPILGHVTRPFPIAAGMSYRASEEDALALRPRRGHAGGPAGNALPLGGSSDGASGRRQRLTSFVALS